MRNSATSHIDRVANVSLVQESKDLSLLAKQYSVSTPQIAKEKYIFDGDRPGGGHPVIVHPVADEAKHGNLEVPFPSNETSLLI